MLFTLRLVCAWIIATVQIGIRSWFPFVLPSPLPAEPPTFPEPKAPPPDTERGREAFASCIRVWAHGYGAPVPQPGDPTSDATRLMPTRQEALMTLVTAHGRAAGAYIKACGGLASAVFDVLVSEGLEVASADVIALVPLDLRDDVVRRLAIKRAKHIALNITQVGSVMNLPMDHLLERSFFEGRPQITRVDSPLLWDFDDSFPSGGPIGAVVFDRPKYEYRGVQLG